MFSQLVCRNICSNTLTNKSYGIYCEIWESTSKPGCLKVFSGFYLTPDPSRPQSHVGIFITPPLRPHCGLIRASSCCIPGWPAAVFLLPLRITSSGLLWLWFPHSSDSQLLLIATTEHPGFSVSLPDQVSSVQQQSCCVHSLHSSWKAVDGLRVVWELPQTQNARVWNRIVVFLLQVAYYFLNKCFLIFEYLWPMSRVLKWWILTIVSNMIIGWGRRVGARHRAIPDDLASLAMRV